MEDYDLLTKSSHFANSYIHLKQVAASRRQRVGLAAALYNKKVASRIGRRPFLCISWIDNL